MRMGSLLAVAAALIVGATAIPAHAATIQVVITNLEFSPAEVSAKVGDTIEWVNKDPFTHTATVDKAWEVVVAPKTTGRIVLQQAGGVDYYCRFHPNMKGRIVVTSP